MEVYGSEEKTEIDLEEFKDDFEEFFNSSEVARLLLTLMRCKPATDVEGFFRTEQDFSDFVSKVNSGGFNCYVEKNPEETFTELVLDISEEDREEETEMVEEAEVVAWIFITEEDLEEEFFEPIVNQDYGSKYHRRYGEFLGFEEESIESYIYFNLSRWRKILQRIHSEKPPDSLPPLKAAEKFGSDLSEEDMKSFTAFTFGRIPDSEEFFEKKMKEARESRDKIESSSLDLEFFLENLCDPRMLEE
jgi:hypothetical protein